MKPVVLVKLASNGSRLSRADDRAKAFRQHQCADDPEEDDVGKLDDKIDLSDFAQEGEQGHTKRRADHASGHEDPTHLEVDIATAHVRQHA